MKKIGFLLLKHVEKIILALCMIVLIFALATQLSSLSTIRGEIKKVLEEAIAAGNLKGGKQVPEIDQTGFDLAVDAREVWKPSATLGTWSNYKTAGPEKIFANYRKPPATLSEDYVAYLEDYGPGSLFDPPLYVRPLNGSAKLLAFESTHDYESPYAIDIPGKNTTGGPEDPVGPEDPTKPKIPKEEPGALVRLVRINSPKLPFIFLTAMGKQGTFQVGRRQKILNEGDVIAPGYTFVTIESKKVNDWKSVYSAVVQTADGTEIKMASKKVVVDPSGESSYVLTFFPRVRNTFTKKAGDVIKLTYAGKTVDYKIEAAAGQVSLVELSNGQPTERKPFMVNNFNRTEYGTWVKKVRAALEAERGSTTPGEDGM